jgi:hypothetical protein
MKKTLLVLGSTILAVALAGCGGANDSSSSASPTADREEMGLKFAQCMRQHGVAMEDPKPGGGIRITANDKNAAKVEAAQKACQKYAPMMQADPKQQAEDLDRMTKLAQCLRRNGIQVEDPKPGQPFAIKSKKGDGAKTEKAMRTCQAVAGGPARADGDSGTSGQGGGGGPAEVGGGTSLESKG